MRAFSPVTAFIGQRDVSRLDQMLTVLHEGVPSPRVVASAVYDGLSHADVQFWCHRHAFYGLPTDELVGWLRERIGKRTAIEIGAGNGALGRALGIPTTDSFVQQDNPEVVALYRMTEQPLIQYGADVEKLEAVDAVRKYRPQVVIGSWITEYVSPLEDPGPGGGSIYGVRENEILDHEGVEAYILVGNLSVHGKKRIRSRRHEVVHAPWIRSRSSRPDQNCIIVWGR